MERIVQRCLHPFMKGLKAKSNFYISYVISREKYTVAADSWFNHFPYSKITYFKLELCHISVSFCCLTHVLVGIRVVIEAPPTGDGKAILLDVRHDVARTFLLWSAPKGHCGSAKNSGRSSHSFELKFPVYETHGFYK